MPQNVPIQIRRGTAAQWTSANPVLAVGELAYETDTTQLKCGDGVSHYNSLAYINPITIEGAVSFGAVAGTACEGNDSRLPRSAPPGRRNRTRAANTWA